MNHKSEAANLTRRTCGGYIFLYWRGSTFGPVIRLDKQGLCNKRFNRSLSSIADNRYLKCSVFTKPDQI